MNTPIPDWSKEFDERFELESEGCSECGGFELIDKTIERYPNGSYHCEYDLVKIKSFISSLLLQRDRELVEKILKRKKGDWCENCKEVKGRLRQCGACRRQRVYNSALSDILNLIKKR